MKSKRNGNSDNILFIDASGDYTPGKSSNILEDCHIQKIVDAYVARQDIEKYAHVASMKEIEENGWNMNIPRYVDTFEEEEQIDIAAVRSEIQDISTKKLAAIDRVNHQMRLLGL